MRAECDNMRRKYDELAQAYREKGRKLLQTQELYDRIKRKAELGQMQAAACHEIDSQLGGHPLERTSPQGPNGQGFFEQQESYGIGNGRARSLENSNLPGMPPPPPRGFPMFPTPEGTWRRQNLPNSGKSQCHCTLTTTNRLLRGRGDAHAAACRSWTDGISEGSCKHTNAIAWCEQTTGVCPSQFWCPCVSQSKCWARVRAVGHQSWPPGGGGICTAQDPSFSLWTTTKHVTLAMAIQGRQAE